MKTIHQVIAAVSGQKEQPPVTDVRIRDSVLDTAGLIINGDRAKEYGNAFDSFERIATMWSALLDQPVSPSQVARCMIALKLSRLTETATHVDSWVDIAGYAALGAEVARQE